MKIDDRYVEELDDQDLAKLCANLGSIDRAVTTYTRKIDGKEPWSTNFQWAGTITA